MQSKHIWLGFKKISILIIFSLEKGINNFLGFLNLYHNLLLALATIALVWVTYLHMEEAGKMRIETKKLVDLSIEQFKIKSYPNFLIEAPTFSAEPNILSQEVKIHNKGEVTAFKVTSLFVNCYIKDSKMFFTSLSNTIYESEGESRTGTNFEINITRDQWVNYTSRGPFPPGYSLTDLKAFLLFIKFKVPYDDKYRYEPFGFIFSQDGVVSKTGKISYKLSPMKSKDTMVYVKKNMETLKNMTSQSMQYVKDFFVDYKAD